LRIPVQMRNARPMEPAIETRTTIVLRAMATLCDAAAEGLPVGVSAGGVVEDETAITRVLVVPGTIGVSVVEVVELDEVVDVVDVVVVVLGATLLVVFRGTEDVVVMGGGVEEGELVVVVVVGSPPPITFDKLEK
jgi:hypothetical protein